MFIFQIFLSFQAIWSRFELMLGIIFNVLWLLPLFLVSKIVCGLWFGDVAEACYFTTYGKPVSPERLSAFVADLIFSLVVQIVFLIQCSIVSQFPLEGIDDFLIAFHFSLIHAWYAFEYKWVNFGYNVKQRIAHLHTFWAYYVGFGLSMHLITTSLAKYLAPLKIQIMSGCLFSAAFPFFIISAISANRELKLETDKTFPLKIFTPSIKFSDWIIVKFNNWKLKRHKPIKKSKS